MTSVAGRGVRPAGGRPAPDGTGAPAPVPLHPHLVTLIGDYRTAHVRPSHRLLLPRENGRPLDRHTVTRLINNRPVTVRVRMLVPERLLRSAQDSRS